MSTSPRRLGKYELLEQLGEGGTAEVWKAFDPQLKRYVAIVLQPSVRQICNTIEILANFDVMPYKA